MKNLLRLHGFIALVTVIFLNAFIDLGHKIIIQNTVFKLYDGSEQIILTAIVNALILLPFIIFFHASGKTADTYPKATILRAASIAALLITCCISLCYWKGLFWTAFALTFFMGVQSAWYGPAKYGLLKELVSNQQLSLANGIAQTMATLGILVGILFFSILFENRFIDSIHPDAHLNTTTVIQTMTPLSWLLIATSLFECFIAYTLPIYKSPKPLQQQSVKKEINTIFKSPILFPAIIGLAVFWSVGQMLLAVYPAFAKTEIGITNTVVIQGLLATIGIGIMLGSILAGKVSKTHIEMALIPIAGIGVILLVFLLPLITSIIPAAILFFGVGIVGGLLIVPLNAVVQYCTAPEKLGITIANSNLIQNISMLICLIITMAAALIEISAKNLLFFIGCAACLGMVIVIYKLPHSLTRFYIKPNKLFFIEGFDYIPGNGALLMLINHLEDKYYPLIQISYPRKILFSAPTQWTENSCICLSREQFNRNGMLGNMPNNTNTITGELIVEENKITLRFNPQFNLQ